MSPIRRRLSFALTASAAVFLAATGASAMRAAPCDPKAAARPGVDAGEHAWQAWGLDPRNTRYRPAGPASLAARDVPRLRVRWAFSLGDVASARSQPAVLGGTVFVGSEAGRVHALGAESGCARWTYEAGAPVRTAVVATPAAAGRPAAVYVGDAGGHVHAVDAASGRPLWKVRVDSHPAAVVTGAPQPYRGVLYVPVSSYESVLPLQPGYACCTFRGSVVALDAATGRTLWKTYTIDDSAGPVTRSKAGAPTRGPSGAAVWSTPTVDERLDRLYVGTGNNYSDPPSPRSDAIVALDRQTGAVVWSRQFTAADAYNASCDFPGKPACPDADGPDADFGQPPILVSLSGGRRALVVGQKSGVVRALDPDREGAVLWEATVGPGGRLGGIHWGAAADGRNVYVALGGQELRGVRDTTVKEGFRLEPDPTRGGGLFALRLATGERVWSAAPPTCGARARCSPAQSAPVTAIPGIVFSGALDGHLRAHSTTDGAVVWDLDTAREYPTVNGLPARGGSLDVAGAVVVGKMLYAVSGYAQFGAIPGNVLLALSVDGR